MIIIKDKQLRFNIIYQAGITKIIILSLFSTSTKDKNKIAIYRN